MSSLDPLSPEIPVKRVLPAETASVMKTADIAVALEDSAPLSFSSISSAVMGVYDEILRCLAQGDGIESASSLLAEKIRLLTQCGSSAIAFFDPDGETLTFTAAAGHEAQD